MLTGVFVVPLQAQVVAYDDFGDYAAAAQLESGSNNSPGTGLDGGSGWGGTYDVSNAIKSLVKIEDRTASPVDYENGEIVIAGGNRALRFYDTANGSYAVQRPLAAAFNAAEGEILWFSFLFRTASGGASPLANQDFFQVGFDDNASASSGSPRVSIGANTISTTFPSGYYFFARSSTAVTSSAFQKALPIAAATTYLLVGCIQPNSGTYDTVRLFVNPATLDNPGPASAVITLPSGLATLSHAFIRTAYLDNGDAYVLDEWRIGRDYGSVVQSLRNALQIIPSGPPGAGLKLRWPASLSGVVLESSATLAPESWSEVAGPFTRSGKDYEFPVPIAPGVSRAFFRLRR